MPSSISEDERPWWKCDSVGLAQVPRRLAQTPEKTPPSGTHSGGAISQAALYCPLGHFGSSSFSPQNFMGCQTPHYKLCLHSRDSVLLPGTQSWPGWEARELGARCSGVCMLGVYVCVYACTCTCVLGAYVRKLCHLLPPPKHFFLLFLSLRQYFN